MTTRSSDRPPARPWAPERDGSTIKTCPKEESCKIDPRVCLLEYRNQTSCEENLELHIEVEGRNRPSPISILRWWGPSSLEVFLMTKNRREISTFKDDTFPGTAALVSHLVSPKVLESLGKWWGLVIRIHADGSERECFWKGR